MNNVSNIMRTLQSNISSFGSYTSTNNDVLRTVRSLQALGDDRLNGLRIIDSMGRLTVSRAPVAVATNTRNTGYTAPKAPAKPVATKNNNVITRSVTNKGVTVPQALLAGAGIRPGTQYVYLRPINGESFLVMRTRGTNQGTTRHGVYADGRVVLSRTVLGEMVGVDGPIGEFSEFTFAKNGNTANTILVTRL